MELILWRHAEAAEGTPDDVRPLTSKGQRQAARMADFLLPRLPQDTCIISSPALRAQETVTALGKPFITAPNIGLHASVQTVLATAGWPAAKNSVLLAGHQPWMGQLAAYLMTDHTAPWHIKKGAIWWFSQRMQEDQPQTILRLAIAPDQL